MFENYLIVFAIGKHIGQLKEHHSRAFRAFFEIENIENLTMIVSANDILHILDNTLEAMKQLDNIRKFDFVAEVVSSKLFNEEPVKTTKISVELVLQNLPNNFAKLPDKYRHKAMDLIKCTYEKIKKSDFEEKQKLLDYFVENMLPLLVYNIKKGKTQKILLLICLLEDVNEETLEIFSKLDKFCELFDKLFELLQKIEYSFMAESNFELRLSVYLKLSKFMELISSEKVLHHFVDYQMDTFTPVVNNLLFAIGSIVPNQDLTLTNLTASNRQYIINKYGDIQLQLCKTMKKMIEALFPDKLLRVMNRYNEEIMDVLFNMSLNVSGEAQQLSIELILTFTKAEFLGSVDGRRMRNFQMTYTWFISRIIKSFFNNEFLTNAEYRKKMSKIAEYSIKTMEETLDEHDFELYKTRIILLLSHLRKYSLHSLTFILYNNIISQLEKLAGVTYDAVRVEEHFKENEVILCVIKGVIVKFKVKVKVKVYHSICHSLG